MVLPSTYIGLVLTGIFSHVAYFNKGEHHLYGLFYIKCFLLMITAGTAGLSFTQGLVWTTALGTVSKPVAAYLLGLYGSLLIYRIFLHPLCKFPGPFAARISTLWLTAHSCALAPLICIEAVHGASSRCTKGIIYDFSYPTTSLPTHRDPTEHHARRRVWSTAFSDKMLRGYEQRIRGYRKKLVDRVIEMEGQPIEITKWFNLYSFDVMGDLSFGQGFESLEKGEAHWAIKLLNGTMGSLGLMLPAWLFLLVAAIPGLLSDFWQFLDFCGKRIMERLENEPEIPDISSPLIAPVKGRKISEQEKDLLYGDSRLVIIAGSDTTSGTLSTIFYELVRHPEEFQKLRAELAPYLDNEEPDGEFLHSKIVHLKHLNGVINEALRLYPAVPSALQRKVPPEGIVIDGVHIPGGTHVYCPLYAMARSNLCYEKPCEFIPERWYKYPELVKDKRAFAPFNIGPYNCIGRPLALMNIRTTVARLVMEFDVELAPGEDGSRFLGKAKDNFVLYYGELNLAFTHRK
ncbi:hypothetical protein P175DRAFT_0513208 [Aspergillus ochraceoroseus IBT 24754]|uniref:Cytochrome P450 n=1 Tax=Aspergillus ochraceoroseus IBT 24754 TaxID=1392256 RepID=A0A2T5M6L4_9EURO|nr:uncharacterized protein P175DRAFT_0513208 [Aspergillus ochraceoroseus IBT 24754]PTU24177.1 hypothetical protein P175DRAFT_0513208 [Aspergillus ochraceoroseus IBT 24754]